MLPTILLLVLSAGALWYSSWMVSRACTALEESNRCIKFLLGRLKDRQREVDGLRKELLSLGYDEEDLEYWPEEFRP